MQQFSLVYNNLFVFLEPVDEPRPVMPVANLCRVAVEYPTTLFTFFMLYFALGISLGIFISHLQREVSPCFSETMVPKKQIERVYI